MVPLVIRIEDLQTGAVSKSAFIKSPVRIGRSELNDLPLPQGFVSQWHAVVQFDETEVRYVDLGSTNGSIVDGVRIERNAPVPIGGGTEVRIGSLKLTLSRRTTGEHRAPPRTIFSIRAATAFPPAAQAPGAPPAEGAPAAPEAAAPDADASSRAAAAAATPPGPAGPPGGSVAAPVLEVGVRSERAPSAPVLDLPTGFRAAAATPPSAQPSPAPNPVLDLPTEFRPAVVAPPPAAPSSPAAAPMLDLPTEFRPAVKHPPGAPSAALPSPAPPPGAGPSDIERLVTTFAESYLPASVRIGGFGDAEAFLGKLAETLEAFARAFVEMRKGYEEFGKQMGIRTVHGDGPVQRARDPRQLIAVLLDPGQQGRATELQTSFADYMVHQVALLNGVVEGAKAILSRVSPDEIEAAAPQSMWPLKAQTLWRSFEERFHELFDEDGAISDALFGREFGKAYTAIVGQRGAEERDEDRDEADEDEDDEDGAPRRPAKKGPRPGRR